MNFISTALIALSAAIIGLLGLAHLAYTFIGHKLDAQDPELQAAMKAGQLNITNETSVWRATKGFNASHSLGALLFAAIYGYLAIAHLAFLQQSHFLLVTGLIMLLSLLLLAKLYWFSLPLKGIALATALYGLGALILLLSA